MNKTTIVYDVNTSLAHFLFYFIFLYVIFSYYLIIFVYKYFFV